MKILNKISQEYLLKLLGLDTLPQKYLDIYNEFIDYLNDADEEFMSLDELEYVSSLLKLNQDVYAKLKIALIKINKDYEAKVALYYFKYITYIAFYSTSNQLFCKFSSYAIDDYLLHSFTVLAPIKWRYEEAMERHIPKKYMVPQLKDVSHHVNRWVTNERSDGVIRWDTIVAYLELFQINTLTIEPFENSLPWHAFKNKDNEKLILMFDNKRIRKDGQFDGVNGVYNYSFTTSYKEDDKFYYGNPVDPYGVVLKDVVKLDKSKWKPILTKDEWVIEFHVSSRNPYTIENFQISLKKAMRFLKKYYPERKFVAVRGFSWLFSPQLKYIMDENKGNISRIKKCGYTIPTNTGEGNVFNFIFHKVDIKPEEIPETTSLYKGIKKYLLEGGRINCGEMMFFLDDIDKMMDNVYMNAFPKIIDELKNDAK